MKPPDEVRRELVTQWLRQADDDFALAEYLADEEAPFPAAVAFHAQQAAEKYLKAFLVAHQIEFPKTHDLGRLLDLVATIDGSLATSLADTVPLTDYAVDVRYPGELPEIGAADAKHAVQLAAAVRSALLGRLRPAPSES